jgi:hypothetical protein
VRLYEAHADGTDIGPLSELKLGRQIDELTPVYAWFDGVSARSKPINSHDLEFGAYGGLPVHLHESSRNGDLLAGVFAESKLWPDGRARVDWMHLKDDTSASDRPT